jgi:uncharacterized protein (DUF2252 family)
MTQKRWLMFQNDRTTIAERLAQGKAQRERVPRASHAQWAPAKDRPDVVAMLEASSIGRLPELIPIRYGRMTASPFAFLRGSAGVMALDLAATPTTGIQVQLCGDCHLMNFGGFGTPERNFVFDITDFDETLPGPWEWDVKRLTASVVAAGRDIGLTEKATQKAARACIRSYREQMRRYAVMHTLDLWYERMDGKPLLDLMQHVDSQGRPSKTSAICDPRSNENLVAKLTEVVDGKRRFRDKPPLIFHPSGDDSIHVNSSRFLKHYRDTLQEDRRALLERYHDIDTAIKVVGVGSVGTRCLILLLKAEEDDLLVLQYKEAVASVLEPFVGKSKYPNHAQRVVCGQRILQSASDMFLGWSSVDDRDFYFRQLRDMKTSVVLEGMSASDFTQYVTMCGAALARGHAKSGDAAAISGYLGSAETFDDAVAAFACAYADQAIRDYDMMMEAVKTGRIVAQTPAKKVKT